MTKVVEAGFEMAKAAGATPEQLAELRERVLVKALASDKRYDDALARAKGADG